MLGLKRVDDNSYVGLFSRGDCPVYDYGAGVLCLTWFVNYKNELTLYVNSLDDGGATGWGKPEITGAQARKKLFLVAEQINNKMGKKIYWETLLAILNRFGVYVVVE
jgi:hypothetical protein